jgi:hypothetical protein
MHAGLAWGINKFQIAYILATAEWESRFSPIEEIGGKNKPYAPYYGRGYVQLTHKGELSPFRRPRLTMLTPFAQGTMRSTASYSAWTWSPTLR